VLLPADKGGAGAKRFPVVILEKCLADHTDLSPKPWRDSKPSCGSLVMTGDGCNARHQLDWVGISSPATLACQAFCFCSEA